MSHIIPFELTDNMALAILKDCAQNDHRVFYSKHAQERMIERKITNAQVLYCLENGKISEPVHRDIHGDWKCTVSSYISGVTINVAAAIKQNNNNERIIVITVFSGV